MPIVFECKSKFYCTVEQLFSFHESSEGFDTLVGLDKGVKVLKRSDSLEVGQTAILEVEIAPFIKKKWVAEHTAYRKNELFRDEQREGPFRSFSHSHIFQKDGNHSLLLDQIELDFFLLPISKFFILQKMRPQFLNRHNATASKIGVEHKNLFCGFKD